MKDETNDNKNRLSQKVDYDNDRKVQLQRFAYHYQSHCTATTTLKTKHRR